MRMHSPELRGKAAGQGSDERDPEVLFAAVRSAKDRF